MKRCDNSWTSRLVSGLSVITPSGEEKPLKWFFPTRRDIAKRLIKRLFDEGRGTDENGEKRDPEIGDLLKKRFGVYVSRRTACLCRNELGIRPSAKRGIRDGYPGAAAAFSPYYPLTAASVAKYAPSKSGVYELGFKNTRRGAVFYIGSAKDIRKRLKGHLGQNRNAGIKEATKESDCFFRYIMVQKRWRREEKRLYESFVRTFGAGPKCNRVRPGGD